jgi:triphosphoribosyl-dephospho-CoA synthetase
MLGGELDLEMIKQMDDDFIAVGISPGGSADLLAVTYLIFELEKLIN